MRRAVSETRAQTRVHCLRNATGSAVPCATFGAADRADSGGGARRSDDVEREPYAWRPLGRFELSLFDLAQEIDHLGVPFCEPCVHL